MKYQCDGYSTFNNEYQCGGDSKFKLRNEIFEKFDWKSISNINLVDIRYSISNINLLDIRYSNVKISQSDIQIQSQKGFFKEILNIEYQSGGYSIFNMVDIQNSN